jgi:hypothetical protein
MRHIAGGLSRRLLVAGALVATLSLFPVADVAGASAPHHYPPSFKKVFISACVKAARAGKSKTISKRQATAYCSTALACIEKKLTVKQFELAAEKMKTGKHDPNARVLTACERSAAKKTLG